MTDFETMKTMTEKMEKYIIDTAASEEPMPILELTAIAQTFALVSIAESLNMIASGKVTVSVQQVP
jgi:hypothetical protein